MGLAYSTDLGYLTLLYIEQSLKNPKTITKATLMGYSHGRPQSSLGP